MTYKNLKVIDSSWIARRIEVMKKSPLSTLAFQQGELFALELIQQKLIDATPILTDCWDECQAICKCNTDMGEVMASREYLEQFLNTEINQK